MLNRSTEFPSKGPKASIEDGVKSTPETSLGQLYAGLLSFPVGPLGVMEVLSIFSESMDDMLKNEIPFTPDGTVRIENPEGWTCVTEQPLDGLMSPMTDHERVFALGYILWKRGTHSRVVTPNTRRSRLRDTTRSCHSIRFATTCAGMQSGRCRASSSGYSRSRGRLMCGGSRRLLPFSTRETGSRPTTTRPG